VFVFITHEAAGASTPGIPHALEFFQGDRLMHTSGAPRRENAEVCREDKRAKFPAVIAREGGRSSIPETPVMESRSRGVLDRPVKPDDDSYLWRSKTTKQSITVVPAKAGYDTLTVIASEAKQSTARATVTMDCFVASLLAMTAPARATPSVVITRESG
jgi:hypothetical protein